MTSNLGSALVLKGGRMGFAGADQQQDFQRIEEEILGELKRAFSPEFINRVDDVIVFNPLGRRELRAIVDLLIDDVNETIAERKLRVELTDAAKEWLLDRAGVEPSTGARPLRRTIQRHVQDAISDVLIHGSDHAEALLVDVDGDALTVEALEPELIS
jgi:ATP-dependent Clp protease ATP-binding subunit ClpC